MSEEEPSINIPSLLTLAVVSYFVIRWFLNRDASSPGTGGGSGRGRENAVDPAQVEQVLQMFPQLSSRDVIWDLQRNGGSVAATTERILSGRGLEVPPLSFQPQIAIPSVRNVVTQTASASGNSKPERQDLISRYNLNSRVANNDSTEPSSPPSTGGWSQNKEERQRSLQKRRDDMILAARRRILQKDQEVAQ